MPADRTERKPTAYETLAAERQRLFDLVRYCRHTLHADGLISNEEYSEIVVGGSAGNADGGSVKRLGGYDEVRAAYTAELAALKQERDELQSAFHDCFEILKIALKGMANGAFRNAVIEAEWPRFERFDAARTAQQEGKP